MHLYRSFTIVLAFLISCSSCKETKEVTKDKPLTSEESIDLNISLQEKETEEINLFIRRYDWVMEMTGTGLRYEIYYKSGDTLKPVKGDELELKYRVMGLDGVPLYDSKIDGLMKVKVEQDQTPRGIREGVQLMSLGDKARFILPSHLAYGVHGDENKVSHSQVLVYDIELISIKK